MLRIEQARKCKYFLKEGSVAVDVGANVELVTLAMAKLLGENGKVIAIEP